MARDFEVVCRISFRSGCGSFEEIEGIEVPLVDAGFEASRPRETLQSFPAKDLNVSPLS